MVKVFVTDTEAAFLPHELFFSKTDKRGIICACNKVFTRISGYSDSELMGAPHNLVRHPDMPKAVFKLLWDTIQAGNPIGAYVKNRSKDGSYYWVFAVVWPIGEGFLSLRLKPMSSALAVVRELYDKVRGQEVSGGVDASMSLMLAEIQALGFSTYEDFMSSHLASELEARDRILVADKASAAVIRTSARSSQLFDQIGVSYEKSFQNLIQSKGLAEAIATRSRSIAGSFEQLKHLSINMAATSSKIGKDGATLSEVAEGFRRVAAEIRESMTSFEDSMVKTLRSVASSQFEIGGARLQVEMIRAFLAEETGNVADSRFAQSLRDLISLASGSSVRVLARTGHLQRELTSLLGRCEELKRTVSGLEVIRMSGRVEVSKLEALGSQAFSNHIDEMRRFTGAVLELIKSNQEDVTKLLACFDQISSCEEQVQRHLKEREKEVAAMAPRVLARA